MSCFARVEQGFAILFECQNGAKKGVIHSKTCIQQKILSSKTLLFLSQNIPIVIDVFANLVYKNDLFFKLVLQFL